MERLRYVARSGGGDPATVVADTVEAIRSLAPAPGELVTVCRNLVDRAITCGPLWWLCAHLLSEPEALATAWDLVDEITEDRTADRLALAIPEDATVLTVGYPPVAARAFARRGDVTVLAVDAAHAANGLIRLLDRNDVECSMIAPEGILAAARESDLVVVDAEACSDATVVTSIGGGLAAVAAGHLGVPVWLVAGRGRRLPASYVDVIAARAGGEFETFPTTLVTSLAGPDGVRSPSAGAFAPECRSVPELIPGP